MAPYILEGVLAILDPNFLNQLTIASSVPIELPNHKQGIPIK